MARKRSFTVQSPSGKQSRHVSLTRAMKKAFEAAQLHGSGYSIVRVGKGGSRSVKVPPMTRPFTVRVPLVTNLAQARFQPEVWQSKEALLMDAVVTGVLYQIALTVTMEIVRLLPSGWRGLKAYLAQGPEVFLDQGMVCIGNIWKLNEVTGGLYPTPDGDVRSYGGKRGRGRWRYGGWFNLEWGREFPHRGKQWVYQENPGPADYPGGPGDHPPGAGPADIEMTRWLRSAPGTGPVRNLGPHSSRNRAVRQTFQDYRVYQRPVRMRKLTTHGVDPFTGKKRTFTSTRSGMEWYRYRDAMLRNKSERTGRRRHGTFGQAPFRRGFTSGIWTSRTEIPTLMKEALKARRIGR